MNFINLICSVAALATVAAASDEVLNSTEPSFCGQNEPDSEKTCISIRLPWQEEPIYFCTDKGKISYKDRCGHEINRWCYGMEREHTLKIATPWDCCPITSIPDYCAGRNCPAAPFNRTCEEILPDKKDPWDCCSTFYCDQDVTPSECHMKRLTPGCMSAPKNKTNCIGFRDQHGCCHKYQCEGEGKPGMCPMEAQAMKFKQLMLDAKSRISKGNITNLSKKIDLHRHKHFFRRFYGGGSTTYMRCTGDHTCPGQMKCCSGDIESYHGVRKILSRSSSNRAVYGYCQEPVEMDADESNDNDSTSAPLTIIDISGSTESSSNTGATSA